MIEASTEGIGNIPPAPALIIPNRVDLPTLRAMEEALGGRERVSWMVENSLRPDPEVMMYLSQSRAAGFLCAMERSDKEDLVNMVKDRLAQGRHVVLLCGKSGQQPAGITDVPGKLLSFADNSTLSAVPVYVGMYRDSLINAIATSAPYEYLGLQFMPEQKAGPALGARIRSAWMDAATEQMTEHPALHQPLAHTLIKSLVTHQNALIIDGVDDSQLSFRRLLIYALILSDKLKKMVTNRRLGIILPPGKLAAVANVACIIAGITPVNINYSAGTREFEHQASMAGVNRFITEVRFTHKLQEFPWPAPRDLIFIDRELADAGTGGVKLREIAIRLGKVEMLTRHMKHHTKQADNEAVLHFTSSTEGKAKGVPCSNHILLSAIMQLSSRLPIESGRRVLSALPLYMPAGFICGLLLPLLQGLDIVTYPDTHAPRRLCELAHNYGTVLTAFTPAQTHAILSAGKPEHFATLRYFLITGGKLSAELAERAARDYKLHLRECYSLAECAPPVAISGPTPQPAPGTPHIIPAGKAGSVGAPLTGIAVRISDLNRPDHSLPITSTGLIWLKSPALISAYLKDKPEATTCMRGKWFCTGDVGYMDNDGLLTICGRKERFSKIGDELVPHEAAEAALCQVLGASTADGVRRLAVVGVPDPRSGGEILVLLSTLHKNVVPQDLITARYGLLNARYPAAWAPNRIIPVGTIPVQPDGKLNYNLCYQGACRLLGIQLD